MATTVTIEITLAKYTLNVLGQNGGIDGNTIAEAD